jgi:hypothetical protein
MLLQGSYFSADVLAEIANQLDDEEKRVLSEQARANFKSQNLDDSGFFSIQVITAALHRSWDLLLVPIQSPSMAEYAQNPGYVNYNKAFKSDILAMPMLISVIWQNIGSYLENSTSSGIF